MAVKIVKTGIHCSVQDQGRRGFQRYGVPVSGAVDKHAAAVANLLVGNDHSLAVLEFVLHGAVLMFEEDALIAFSGTGSVPAMRRDSLHTSIPIHKTIFVPKNTIIELQYASRGCWMYMAIAGGFDMPTVMNSRSVYEAAGAGKKLTAGDQVKLSAYSEVSQNMLKKTRSEELFVSKWSAIELIEETSTDCIRVMRGHEWTQFSKVSQNKWLNDHFTVSNAVDRMGMKLESAGLKKETTDHGKPPPELISTAVAMGTVQVLPDGSPMILMADAQTTGGYPRIAQVIDNDLSLLAQQRPGDKIRFREVSPLVAEELYINRQNELLRLKRNIRTRFAI